MIFEFNKNKEKMSAILKSLSEKTDSKTKQKAEIFCQIITDIISVEKITEFYDDKCLIIKKEKGDKLTSIIGSQQTDYHSITILFYILSLAIRETYLSSTDLKRAFVVDMHEKVRPFFNPQQQTDDNDYFCYGLPMAVLDKRLNNHTSTVSESEGKLSNKIENVDNIMKILDNKISIAKELETKVDEKTKYLENISQKLDFGVLSKQISEMAVAKGKEKTIQLKGTFFFGALMIVPIAIALYVDYNYYFFSNSNQASSANSYIVLLVKLIPFATLEIIFLYFFRIALQGYMSTKRQLLRLAYRATVARFTNDYIKFVKEHKQDDKSDHLAKFEALIYSEISFDDSNIPSPYDGLEVVVSKAVKNAR